MRFLVTFFTMLIGCVVAYPQSDVHVLKLCWLPQAQFAGYIVADKEGLYDSEGVNIRLLVPLLNEDLLKSLVDGKADFVMATLLDGLKCRHKGEKIVNILQCTQKSAELLVALKKSGIQKFSDLNGRNIGFWPNVTFHASYINLLKKNNVEDYTVYPTLQGLTLFFSGGISATMAMSFNEYHQILFAGYRPEELTVFRMEDTFPGLVFDGVYVNEDFLKERPDLVEGFRKASIEGWKRAFANPKKTLDLIENACREHNMRNPENYAAFNKAAQRRMLEEMRSLILLEGNNCILKEESFKQGMNILEYPLQDIKYKEFMPIEALEEDLISQ